MSDLLDRLRESIADAAAYGTSAVVPLPELRWAADEIDRLRAENEALRADAERYRWLRAMDGPDCDDPYIADAFGKQLNTEEADQRIDAARGVK